MKFFLFVLLVLSCLSGENVIANVQPRLVPPNLSTTNSEHVKLIFIHHSVGGYWLAHENGGLVNELNKYNIYVNDITYGWTPPEFSNTVFKRIKLFAQKLQRKIIGTKKQVTGAYLIGDRTDIGNMSEWFLGSDSELIMNSIYKENLETTLFGDHSNSSSTNPLENRDPKKQNQIIMFKSCFPNTLLRGEATDPPSPVEPSSLNFRAGSDEHTVANAKNIFNGILTYFGKHPDKFFVIVTPPPQSSLPANGDTARGFSNWLVFDWLNENNYNKGNVFVFDLFNILTSGHSSNQNDAGEEQGNHHRIWNGNIQHVIHTGNNLLAYPTARGDDHPSAAGLQKASKEFVPLLAYYFNRWQNEKH